MDDNKFPRHARLNYLNQDVACMLSLLLRESGKINYKKNIDKIKVKAQVEKGYTQNKEEEEEKPHLPQTKQEL